MVLGYYLEIAPKTGELDVPYIFQSKVFNYSSEVKDFAKNIEYVDSHFVIQIMVMIGTVEEYDIDIYETLRR